MISRFEPDAEATAYLDHTQQVLEVISQVRDEVQVPPGLDSDLQGIDAELKTSLGFAPQVSEAVINAVDVAFGCLVTIDGVLRTPTILSSPQALGTLLRSALVGTSRYESGTVCGHAGGPR